VLAWFRHRISPVVVATVLVAAVMSPGLSRPARAQEPAPAAAPDYTVGAPDVLQITVWKQADLSGRFDVAEDGTITYPLLGKVQVAGKKVADIEQELTTRLKGGFLKNPQVSVTVHAFRSQQIFVLGEVKTPGPVPLTGGMTVIEALVHAGSLSESLGGEVVVSRLPGGGNGRPVLPGAQGATEVLRVDLKDLRAGKMEANIALQNGDTVFVTRAETVFVEGQVNNPGAYVVEKNMTVLRLITLAGGPTQVGSAKKARIRRVVDGKVTLIKAKPTDVVVAGDTVIVPTRLI